MTADVKSEVVEDPKKSLNTSVTKDFGLHTAHVSSSDFSFVYNVESRGSNAVCNRIKP
jgi:hypothetical protein